MVAQLEGRTLGLLTVAHTVLGAAHLNLIQSAGLVLVMGTAGHIALNAGVGLIKHVCFPPRVPYRIRG